MMQLAWLIPVFPLIGFLVISLGQKVLPKSVTGIFASLMVLASFILSAGIFLQHGDGSETVFVFDWIKSGSLSIPFSFLIDSVSITMLLIVTGVGFLIHVYSIGYMKEDEGYSRFFSYLNLFVFFMLLLVLGSNYVVLFAGWEGVGLCSYLLIGFWFKNTEYNKAANKAFIMNRIGDLGFLLGIILIYVTFGSVSFNEVFSAAKSLPDNQPVITAITLLLFVGAMGKSAQIPLYTWLPDAMAGPTPVSALIHAATMVTAGIYMVVRSNILYSIAPFTLEIVTIIGMATALFAATIALAQTDIKKVLAYSTVSQLGYMFVALGVGAYSTALFHVTTHAFFKALLFLAAGSVIHAMSGEQDIRKMGGLRKKLPITFAVFAIGTFAISGVPPFAGFFSKDEILAKAWVQSPVLFFFLAVTSVLTAIYMFRLFFLTFYGGFRGTHAQEHHLHESPPSMTVPLVLLAILSTCGGFLGLPEVFSEHHLFGNFLKSALSVPASILQTEASHQFEWTLMGVSVLTLALIIYWAYQNYVAKKNIPALQESEFKPAFKVLYHKYYIDEIYHNIIVKPLYAIGNFFWKIVDNAAVDGTVNGVSKTVVWASQTIRYVQTGNVGFYIFAMVFGIIAILVYNLMF
ncbi:MAG: NADH-quinone oxidoreductase subunit L [Bacteroidetes bacterium]|nr:NADH-quinone oxidoreductase subunit L [Bacteroidota bacterium]MBL0259307.1 NADH-quinone oxidoreductase subunit L [Bacteroidota bacterium]